MTKVLWLPSARERADGKLCRAPNDPFAPYARRSKRGAVFHRRTDIQGVERSEKANRRTDE